MRHFLFQQLERLYRAISAQAVEPPLTQAVPAAIAPLVHAALARDYQNRLTNLRITVSEAGVWQDCVPDAPEGQLATQPCETQDFSGWRTAVAGEFPTEGVPTGAEIDFQVESIRSVTWNACPPPPSNSTGSKHDGGMPV